MIFQEMSVNSVMFDDLNENRPLPLNSLEQFHLETDDLSEFTWIFGNGYPGSTLGYGSPSGKLYISDLRIIFDSETKFPQFQSFSCPFNKISQISLQKASIFSLCKTILTATITPVSYIDFNPYLLYI